MKSLSLFAVVIVTSLSAQASELWFHLRVEEHRGKEVRIEVNLPFRAIERSINLIPARYVKETSIRIDDCNLSVRDLRDAWRALQSTPERTWIVVAEEKRSVTMRRDGGDVAMRVHDEWDGEVVEITVPADVFHALISGPYGRFDFGRAIQLLGRRGSGSIVVTDGDVKIVRVWVDSSSEGRVPARVTR